MLRGTKESNEFKTSDMLGIGLLSGRALCPELEPTWNVSLGGAVPIGKCSDGLKMVNYLQTLYVTYFEITCYRSLLYSGCRIQVG